MRKFNIIALSCASNVLLFFAFLSVKMTEIFALGAQWLSDQADRLMP